MRTLGHCDGLASAASGTDPMELRQLRYFVRSVELGSLSQAAVDMGVVTSALSQQISRLEGELSVRLLQRRTTGIIPTEAGIAFLHQAQLVLRHADAAAVAAKQARLSGQVSVGLAPTTANVLGLPLMLAMRERHKGLRVHIVESLSGHLADMLTARLLDLAIVFRVDSARRFSVSPLLDERMFVVGNPQLDGMPASRCVRLSDLGDLPLVLPSRTHNLRAMVDQAFVQAKCTPNVIAEVDGLGTLLDFVEAGHAATIQPGAATARLALGKLNLVAISEPDVNRPNFLVSLSDDELSPAGVAARVVITDVVRRIVKSGAWPGASLHE